MSLYYEVSFTFFQMKKPLVVKNVLSSISDVFNLFRYYLKIKIINTVIPIFKIIQI